jgi:Fe-S-cluster containining protein
MERIIFDGENGTISFNGNCEEMRPICKAFCCKLPWTVGLTKEEYESNRFKAEPYCIATGSKCIEKYPDCINRRYRVLKTEKGVCVHLDSENKCSVHEFKPKVCIEFVSCDHGTKWRISPPRNLNKEKDNKTGEKMNGYTSSLDVKKEKGAMSIYTIDRDTFVENINTVRLILNPIYEIKTLFYSPKKGKLTIIVKSISSCAPMTLKDRFNLLDIKEDHLLFILKMFNGKNDIKSIMNIFYKKFNLRVEEKMVNDLSWFLFRHNILLIKR